MGRTFYASASSFVRDTAKAIVHLGDDGLRGWITSSSAYTGATPGRIHITSLAS
ncbi:MAG TPA: hypothetical protein VGJ60_27270 [Chloroflexota bacterium]